MKKLRRNSFAAESNMFFALWFFAEFGTTEARRRNPASFGIVLRQFGCREKIKATARMP